MDWIEVFIEHLKYDKSFADYFTNKFYGDAQILGEYIYKHNTSQITCHLNKRSTEFMEFLDGNGFTVIYPADKPYNAILIINFEEEENKYEEKESPFGMDVFISTSTLYDTSVETCEGDLLEYSQLSAPRPIWICLRRRMEFLRLVPKSCGRSFTLYGRPP